MGSYKWKQTFLDELSVLGYSKHTINSYCSDLKKLKGLAKADILGVLSGIKCLKSRARCQACFRKYFKWLKDNDYAKNDPMRNMPAVRVPKTIPRVKELKMGRIGGIGNRFKSKVGLYETIFRALYATGMRVGELSRIRLTDLKGDSILIRGKGNKERMVPIDSDLGRGIEEMLKRHGHFPSESQIWRVCKKYLNVNPHAFRHAFATRLARKGISAFTIAALLGHSSVTISEQYIHLAREDLREAVKKANAE